MSLVLHAVILSTLGVASLFAFREPAPREEPRIRIDLSRLAEPERPPPRSLEPRKPAPPQASARIRSGLPLPLGSEGRALPERAQRVVPDPPARTSAVQREPEVPESPGLGLPSTPEETSDRSGLRRSPGPPRQGEGRLDLRRALREFKPPVSPPASSGAGLAGGGVPDGLTIPTGLAGPRFGMGNLEFESGDFDWTDYYRQIYRSIWIAWHTRLYGTVDRFERWAHERGDASLDHEVRIRFTIKRNGQIVDVAVEEPSGCLPLDQSAADTLRVVVLPRLPDAFPRATETVHARFIADGDVRAMRPSLRYLADMGYIPVKRMSSREMQDAVEDGVR